MPKLFVARPVADDGFTNSRRRILLLTLTMTSSLGMVASTIYVPSIPAIADAFGTSISRVQLTFVGYLLAFAASMLVLGPFSDRYGRRRTIICGLSLSALSSIACAVSPTIEFLIARKGRAGDRGMRGTGRRSRDHARAVGQGGCRTGHRRPGDRRHLDAGLRAGARRLSAGVGRMARQFRGHRGPGHFRHAACDPICARKGGQQTLLGCKSAGCWRTIGP